MKYTSTKLKNLSFTISKTLGVSVIIRTLVYKIIIHTENNKCNLREKA
jgi:hypothetical protein